MCVRLCVCVRCMSVFAPASVHVSVAHLLVRRGACVFRACARARARWVRVCHVRMCACACVCERMCIYVYMRAYIVFLRTRGGECQWQEVGVPWLLAGVACRADGGTSAVHRRFLGQATNADFDSHLLPVNRMATRMPCMGHRVVIARHCWRARIPRRATVRKSARSSSFLTISVLLHDSGRNWIRYTSKANPHRSSSLGMGSHIRTMSSKCALHVASQ